MKAAPSLPANVLLVDDSRDGLLVRRAVLEEHGLHVQIAHTGEEGLKLLDANTIDVVVAEYRMPAMSGIEFIAKVRQRGSNVRVLLLSAFVDTLGLTEKNTGADAVLAKNSSEAGNLVRTVRRLANRRPPRKPASSQRKIRSLARVRA
jgi:CheY-like chemotaxis protein